MDSDLPPPVGPATRPCGDAPEMFSATLIPYLSARAFCSPARSNPMTCSISPVSGFGSSRPPSIPSPMGMNDLAIASPMT